jgi:hypothetical protein
LRGRLRRLYPRVSEVYILDAVNHIKNSEVLKGNLKKAELMTDEELKMYYEEIIYDLGGNDYGKKRNNRKN